MECPGSGRIPHVLDDFKSNDERRRESNSAAEFLKIYHAIYFYLFFIVFLVCRRSKDLLQGNEVRIKSILTVKEASVPIVSSFYVVHYLRVILVNRWL